MATLRESYKVSVKAELKKIQEMCNELSMIVDNNPDNWYDDKQSGIIAKRIQITSAEVSLEIQSAKTVIKSVEMGIEV